MDYIDKCIFNIKINYQQSKSISEPPDGPCPVPTLGFLCIFRGALIRYLSHKAIVMISCISHGLHPSIRQSNHEGSDNISLGILGLCLPEAVLAVVI